MNSDELRNRIWDHLFRAKAAQSIAEIATLTDCDMSMVNTAVNHEWFEVSDGRVSIAYAAAVDIHR
jgi:hypothetical protein